MDQKESDVAAKDVVVAEKKEEKSPKKEKVAPEIENLLKELEGMEKIDEKIRRVLDFMRSTLTGEKEAQLGLFWKGRSECMALFKESMTKATRSVLWSAYLELLQEARRVKEILDEASSFAVEQIEIAIKDLEENLENLPDLLKSGKDISLPSFSDKGCLKNRELYLSVQKELVLLNSFASRVQTLRKEVIQTGMRLKIKNRFFARLSACGDHIFPKRREMIKAISEAFIEDVGFFVDAYFKSKTKEAPNYVLREEIKSFQELAKRLTLNSSAFSKGRKELSQAWDIIKEQDKERKKEYAKKRESFKQNFDAVMEKITPLAQKCAEEGAEKGPLEAQAKEILDFMLTVELSREDVSGLKEAIRKAKEPLFEKERALAEERKRQKREKEEKRRERVASLLKEMTAFEENVLSYEEMKGESERLTQVKEGLSLNISEKNELNTLFTRMTDLLAQKHEESVFSKEGEPNYLEALHELLEKKQSEREETKRVLEEYRKVVGGSGLDFEKAMQFSELLNSEKKRLGLIDASIEKIEEHIDKLA